MSEFLRLFGLALASELELRERQVAVIAREAIHLKEELDALKAKASS